MVCACARVRACVRACVLLCCVVLCSLSDALRVRHSRRIPDIKEMMKLPVACKAGLRREEVIAVVLYTGPMVWQTRIQTPPKYISRCTAVRCLDAQRCAARAPP